jgi:hypothetical protein
VKITNYSVSDILGLPSLTEAFPSHQRSLFHNKAIAIRSRFTRTGQSAEPEVFAINFLDPDGVSIPMWCAMHFVGGAHKLLICEFEVDMAPYMGGQTSNLPPSPVNTLDNKSEDAASSFNSKSEPLYLGMETVDVFRGESRCMDVIHLMSRIQEQLSSQTKVQLLLDVIVGIIQELTGSHRCMVYRFDEEYNGEGMSRSIQTTA